MPLESATRVPKLGEGVRVGERRQIGMRDGVRADRHAVSLERHLKRPVQWFAYPAGAHDARIASLVRRADVLAVTTQPGAVQSCADAARAAPLRDPRLDPRERPRRAARRRAWVESARDGDDPHPPRAAGSRRRGGSRSRAVRARAPLALVAAAPRSRRRRDHRLPVGRSAARRPCARRRSRTWDSRSARGPEPGSGAEHEPVVGAHDPDVGSRSCGRVARCRHERGPAFAAARRVDCRTGIQRQAEPDAADRRDHQRPGRHGEGSGTSGRGPWRPGCWCPRSRGVSAPKIKVFEQQIGSGTTRASRSVNAALGGSGLSRPPTRSFFRARLQGCQADLSHDDTALSAGEERRGAAHRQPRGGRGRRRRAGAVTRSSSAQ